MTRVSGRRGMSLLELVVVLAIVAALAALLLPAVASARRSAVIAGCASNMRQVGQAVHAYRAEHRRFPFAAYMPPPFRPPLDPGPPLGDVLAGYLPPTSQAYRCPGDEYQVHARCAAVSASGHGISYLYWVPYYPMTPGAPVAGTDLLLKDLMMWEYAGDDRNGLVSPAFHPGGNYLRWDGGVTFVPGDRAD